MPVTQFFHKVIQKDPEAVYYLYIFLFNFSIGIISATYVLFMLNQHLNLFQVSLVNLSFMIACFLFEIPTGAFADHFGRKNAVILSAISIFFAFGTYYFSSSFSMFIVAEIIAALAMTFSSGALDAWMVDSMKLQGRDVHVDTTFSHGIIILQFASLFSGLLGAYIGGINLRLPMGLGAVLSLVALGAALLLIKEEKRVSKAKKGIYESIKQIGIISQKGITYSLRHKVVLWLTLSSLLSQFGFQALNMYWAPRFSGLVGNQIWLVGWIFAGMCLFMIFGGFLVKKLLAHKRNYFEISIITTLYLTIPVFVASLSSTFYIVVTSFLAYEIGRGMFYPIHKSYLNQYTLSEHRATIFSFDSMAGKVGAALGLLILGWTANTIGIQNSWLISGVILLFLIPVFMRAQYHERRL